MKFKWSLRVVTYISVVAALVVFGWYALSPRWTISKLGDWETNPDYLTQHYDRQRVRRAFERQMLAQVDDFPPPLTKDVLLDALSDPRAVRMFVKEPFGEWQFAAAAGLPPRLASSDPNPRKPHNGDNGELEATLGGTK